MKKNFTLLLCVVMLVAVVLASCKKPCEHTFSDEWDCDKDNHWHPATCEHAETERKDFGAHVDSDEDGVCDVCEFVVGHEHTFEDGWKINETHHWKQPTCSHTDISDKEKNYGAHSDENPKDGVCDVCSGHVHSLNPIGYCTDPDCGKKVKDVDETSLENLAEAILFQKHLVNGGSLVYNYVGRSATGEDFESDKTETVTYIFGKDNYTYIKVEGSYTIGGSNETNYYENWRQLDGVDNVFGIVSENGGELTMDSASPSQLNGYFIALSTLAGDYGVEETFYALYQVAIGDTAENLEVIPDADENKITFKYSYLTAFINETEIAFGEEAGTKVYNVNVFDVQVTFNYSDDYALTGLEIICDCYTNDPGTNDQGGFLYHDVDLQYDSETGEVTFVEYAQDENGEWGYIPSDRRIADTYTITVTQTLGERTEENPNPKSKFIPKSFDLCSDAALTTPFPTEINTTIGTATYIYIGNYAPENTTLLVNPNLISIKCYDVLGNMYPNIDPLFDNFTGFPIVPVVTPSANEVSIFFIPKMEGIYNMEIIFDGKVIHNVKITVGDVTEEDFEIGENQFAVKVTETYSWTNEYTFVASEAGTYYFNLPAGVGFINADAFDNAEPNEEVPPYFDYNDRGKENGGSFSVNLEEGESIRFYVNANKSKIYIISYYMI